MSEPPKDPYRSGWQKTQSNKTRSFWLAEGWWWRRRMNWMQMPPLGGPHTIQSLSVQIMGPLDQLYFHSSPQPRCLSFIPHQKQGCRTLVFRSSPSMELCPWLCTWNTRVTLDFSVGSPRNFKSQLCKLVVFVMFSTSQTLLLTKMSRGYFSTPPPYRCSSFKYTLDYRSVILAFPSIKCCNDFLHLIYILSHITEHQVN